MENVTDQEKDVEKKEQEANAREDVEATQAKEDEKVTPIKEKAKEPDYKSKFYYLAAEMENLKKRFEREKEDLRKYCTEKILSGLVEVVDNFERTVQAIEKDEDEKVKNIVVGIEMIQKQFLSVLKDNGLSQVEALGKMFDPNFHEAMAQQPMEGKKEQEVISEYQKGYILNGRLLRASKVIVATGTSPESSDNKKENK